LPPSSLSVLGVRLNPLEYHPKKIKKRTFLDRINKIYRIDRRGIPATVPGREGEKRLKYGPEKIVFPFCGAEVLYK